MKALQDILKKEGVMEEYPMIIVGAPYRELKAKTNLPLRRVSSQEELLDLISNYSGVRELDNPLLIEDLVYLTAQNQQKLLKFIEETTIKVVLLASYDVISKTLLSRTKLFVKRPLEKTVSNLLPPAKGRRNLSTLSGDTHPLDKVRHQGKESPIMYYNEAMVPLRPNRAKMLSLIE